MTPAENNSLLSRIVEASGLSPIFAESTVRRVLARTGADPDRLTADDVTRGLEPLRKALEGYLGDEAGARIDAIVALTR